MLKNLKIFYKLLTGFIIIAVIPVSIGIVEWNSMNKIRQAKQDIRKGHEVLYCFNNIKQLLYNDLNTSQKLIAAKTIKELESHRQNHFEIINKIKNQTDTLIRLLKTNVENEKFPNFSQEIIFSLNRFREYYQNKSLPVHNQIYDRKLKWLANTNANNQYIDNEIFKKIKTINELSDKMTSEINQLEQQMKLMKQEAEHLSERYMYISKIRTWILILLSIIVGVLLAFRLAKYITKPLVKLHNAILQLNDGNIPEKPGINSKDEIGEMAQSLNILVKNLGNIRNIAIEVGKGNFQTSIDVFGGQGVLGESIEQMKKSLYEVDREQKEQKEREKHRYWTNEGIAKFAGLLQTNIQNIEEFSYLIIKNLVTYLEVNQGGIFLINKKNKHNPAVEMKACFAYNREKIAKKTLKPDEGLIGRCLNEKETIYLSEIPDKYIYITSGLGDENPNTLLIVPMIFNQKVVGVIELASFWDFEPYRIKFVETISENIAGSILNMQTGIETAKLLKQTQTQAEELASQEEELRQNMEEMKATQEEADRKEKQAVGFQNTVNHTFIRAEFNVNGRLKYANTRFLEAMGYHSSQVFNRDVSLFLHAADREWFNAVWQRLAKGGKHYEDEINFKTRSGNKWLFATFTPIKNEDAPVETVLLLALDFDEKKQKEIELLKKLKEIS